MGIVVTDTAPGTEQQHAVCLCQSCAGGMGTHQHRYTQLSVQPQQHLQKFFFRRRIQRRTRLVQQKHPRRAGHSCRQGQQLLFPAGQRGRSALHQRLQMEECSTLPHPPRHGSAIQPGVLRREGQFPLDTVCNHTVLWILKNKTCRAVTVQLPAQSTVRRDLPLQQPQ